MTKAEMDRRYYDRHKTERKAYNHRYYLANKKAIAKQTRTYKQKHKRRSKRWIREWKKKNWARLIRVARERSINIKLEVLSHYGPQGKLQCVWPGCEVTDIDMLSLDHVNNDGAEHRRSLFGQKKGSSGGLYGWVRSKGYPVGFQTLCMNHQWKKECLRRREEHDAKF